jgi:arginine decarboxylase
MRGWNTTDSAELYGIANWGREFLTVNETGNLVILPKGPGGPRVDLKTLMDDLERRGLGMPLLLRFSDLLYARISKLGLAFAKAIAESEFKGQWRGVYPIKVNQQRYVVEDIVDMSGEFHLGLEAGSKPELLVVLALLDDPEAIIVCNGYKDEEYIETALLAQRLGRSPVIVIEKASEVDLCIQVARRLGVRPKLGVRAKLASRGSGRWEASSGDRAKFGLTVGEIVQTVERLKAADMLDCLQMLHFHIGSQVTAIRPFKDALREASRIYVELHKMGANMRYFDVGGGLGVDYDGSHTDFASSVNYTVDEYAADVVWAIQAACDAHEVPHPHVVTESGRAMVAHHAVLVVNVLDVTEAPTPDRTTALTEDDPDVLHELAEVVTRVSGRTYQQSWHDAVALREEVLSRFNLGLLDLSQRAKGERLFWTACARIERQLRDLKYVPDELEGLTQSLADIYYCNFSVFQSMPDAWAVDQLFPIVPIQRLHEKPTRRATLADITCDSDGKLDRFIDLHDVKPFLELHPLNGEPYRLAAFLVGAYQEILGDMHNLFGDTNTVHVGLSADGRYTIDHVVEGDTVTDVLNYVEYNRRDLVRRVRRAAERAQHEGTLSLEETGDVLAAFQRGLEGYTYLE